MALIVAPQVVDGLYTLFRDGYLPTMGRSTRRQSRLCCQAWYDIELPKGALRDTLAAVGIEPVKGRYSLFPIWKALYGDDDTLQQLAERSLARMNVSEAMEVRVLPVAAESEVLSKVFLAVDVPALATRRLAAPGT